MQPRRPRDGSHPCYGKTVPRPTMVNIQRVHLGAHGTGHTHATCKTVTSSYNGAYDTQPSCYGYPIFETAPRPDTPFHPLHGVDKHRQRPGSEAPASSRKVPLGYLGVRAIASSIIKHKSYSMQSYLFENKIQRQNL